jgi:hypothetical protein
MAIFTNHLELKEHCYGSNTKSDQSSNSMRNQNAGLYSNDGLPYLAGAQNSEPSNRSI